VGTADATFSILDDDLISMANGTLNPQQAFMQGKMKIKGK
jgi:putative sterol carrier protein